ncbi:hypothetical protein BHE97_01470 [Aeromicrobium sp. PE09-221]|uniref:ABC transporter permease n=1 Tax=Aeromicrobium sp. PE09-221 TaxID=1898043 RepID=UPI000B3E92B7|nr:ABC transporter permease [Aeromicrobium sp. PE09-221]OUZ12414.1 hypothetical protein BHE97_01470 [Aeromicrobium sp. PE09-221]
MSTDVIVTVPSRRNRRWFSPLTLGCVLVTVVLAACALLGPWLNPFDPHTQDLLSPSRPPGDGHLLGTDALGRDILGRLIEGTQAALVGPVVVMVGGSALSITLGLAAGYFGGRVEAVIMRLVDLLYAAPALLVIIIFVGMVGGGYWGAVVMLIVLSAPAGTRMIRSAVLGQRHLPYVEAAESLGMSKPRIMAVHLLPNIMPTVVASALLEFVAALVGLSTLSFLGLGAPIGSPEWGRMLTENREFLELNPWGAIAPAILIVVAALSATVLGDAISSRLSRGKAE